MSSRCPRITHTSAARTPTANTVAPIVIVRATRPTIGLGASSFVRNSSIDIAEWSTNTVVEGDVTVATATGVDVPGTEGLVADPEGASIVNWKDPWMGWASPAWTSQRNP
jgi:hypothetical protein